MTPEDDDLALAGLALCLVALCWLVLVIGP